MPRKPPTDDLIVVIGSDSEPGRYWELRRDRASQDCVCACPSSAYARTKGCKHTQAFEPGRGLPAAVAVALALVAACLKRRASVKNRAVSLTATITLPVAPDQPTRAILLPND
jgi:hypothetical protein